MANIDRLLSVCEISSVDEKLLTNYWRLRSLTYFHCYLNAYEHQEVSGMERIFPSEIAWKPFESFSKSVSEIIKTLQYCISFLQIHG